MSLKSWEGDTKLNFNGGGGGWAREWTPLANSIPFLVRVLHEAVKLYRFHVATLQIVSFPSILRVWKKRLLREFEANSLFSVVICPLSL